MFGTKMHVCHLVALTWQQQCGSTNDLSVLTGSAKLKHSPEPTCAVPARTATCEAQPESAQPSVSHVKYLAEYDGNQEWHLQKQWVRANKLRQALWRSKKPPAAAVVVFHGEGVTTEMTAHQGPRGHRAAQDSRPAVTVRQAST